MSSPALIIFDRLLAQADGLKLTAAREATAGQTDAAAACLRSSIVLSVAALDTYFHEQGVRLLHAYGAVNTSNAQIVSNYAGSLSVADIQGTQALGLLRLRLSYKTLVMPEKIDDLLAACGLDPQDVWLRATAACNSRPDRSRRLVQLQVDRRNQIAHEGDWDPSTLDFRGVTDAHVDDCLNCIGPLVREFDGLLP